MIFENMRPGGAAGPSLFYVSYYVLEYIQLRDPG
jgi:hypothetical protein